MKKRILEIIYKSYDEWSASRQWACSEGCAACCTQNVTITALEGEQILHHVLSEGKTSWFADKLSLPTNPHRPRQTINEYAQTCLSGQEPPPEQDADPGQACPFLEQNRCAIYRVRPFSCRCFLSQEKCSPSRPALVDHQQLAAATAISQLLEHLGQFEYWGNMLDVLPAMLDISKYRRIREHLAAPHPPDNGRCRTLQARPLPGFLLTEEEYQQVSPLLTAIFSAEINGRTVEAILNGEA